MSGDNWRWARTALQLAGFEKDSAGNYVTPLTDIARARQSLAALGDTALTHKVLVATNGLQYIGDFAHELVENLPGQWSVRVENYPVPIVQEDLLYYLWTPRADPLAHTVKTDRVLAAAILGSESGAELAVVPVPGRNLYRVGALIPEDMNLTPEVAGPSSITVGDEPVYAAHQVSSSLLAKYHRASWRLQLITLRDDLDWAHEAYEPGTVIGPPQPDLAAAFARFATAAPHLISTLRTNNTRLNTHEQAFLEDMDAVFGQPALPQEASTTPQKAADPDPLAVWLLEGQDLVDLARSVSPASWRRTALAPVRTTPALPSPPLQITASLTRR
ncbi:hypothetical protein ACTVZO_07765 [Streptomyces sp. IBSNAI002]|uniref:hypothetical protein n=1 Tax=Streptomyces sp. IBSNAI002 TaxID=3457500 RepID=UPI003FD10602